MVTEIYNGMADYVTGDIIQQITDNENTANLRSVASNYYVAQTFQPTADANLLAVTLKLHRTATAPSGNIWVEIWDTSGGTPSSIITGAKSAKINASDITTSDVDYIFYMPNKIPVSNGTTYAVVINCDYAQDSTYITVRGNSVGGISGQAYTGTSGLSWSAVSTSDLYIKVWSGNVYPVALDNLPPGSVVQVKYTQNTTKSTTYAKINFDDTVPEITEGDEFMTCAITPIAVTNLLKIDVVAQIYSETSNLCVALFQKNPEVASAKAVAILYLTYLAPTCFTFYMPATGLTSETTFSIRVGTGGENTITLNGKAGNRYYGGVVVSSMTITEIKA